MRHSIHIVVALIAGLSGMGGAAQAQGDPPGQAGRLAFVEGIVSIHDDQQTGWSPAFVNTPLTSGDAVWTEPGARSEISLAGTRIRMDGGTQVDMLEVDDNLTRLQIDQGRIDIRTYTLDTRTPYQIVTPRGTITLQQQGDYYVEAGSMEDSTRLGVRSGAAQIQSLNGQTLAVRPGEVGEIYGDAGTPQLRTINSAPPPPAPYWATRDRQIDYALPAQYLSAGVTGYEDLNSYGSWSNDSQYGHVWSPRSVPAGWQPYRTGHWSYVRPWGWTWIDEQPWGYAPYHYGRWANRDDRWFWVPPQRDVQPVYAPALVAFIGGIELALSLGNANDGPVGWFPLGPRETYVPPYTTNRDYYNRINRSAQVQQTELDDRWQRTQHREPAAVGPVNARVNQRFAIVVPTQTFVHSQPVERAALKVAPEKLAAAPVVLVSTPPAPTASLVPIAPAKPTDPKVADPKAADPKARAEARAKADALARAASVSATVPVAKTPVTDMPTLGKPIPQPDKPMAPGPKITTIPSAPAGATVPGDQGRPATPPLVPRTGSAPPQLHDDKGKPAQPGHLEAKPPASPATPHTSPQPTSAHPSATAVPQTEQNPQPTHDPVNRDRGANNNRPPPPAPKAVAAEHEEKATLPKAAIPAADAPTITGDEKKVRIE